MKKKTSLLTKIQLLAVGAMSIGSASATPEGDLATTLTTTITTYGTALTAVVVAGVVMRFTWKWIRSVR